MKKVILIMLMITLIILSVSMASAQVQIPGDFDNDGQLNDGDALYLLRNTLFPERYPITADGDVDSSGSVNDADALYLLRHTLFPERYPLYPQPAVITMQKLCSHTAADTVAPGEKITYTIVLHNEGQTGGTVTVTDTAPANTAYLSGADNVDNNKLSWEVTVMPGEDVTVSYTVQVSQDMSLCDGGLVAATTAAAGKQEASCHDLYIERTLNEIDREYIVTGIKALSDSSYSGLDLAQRIYTFAFTLANPVSDHITDAALEQIAAGENAVLLDMVAPTLFGGKTMPTAIEGVKGSSAGAVTEQDLIIGDLLLAEERVYIYGEDGLYDLEKGAVKADTEAVLAALPQADKYAVVRPSVDMTEVTPSAPRTDVLNDYQKALKATAEAYLLRGEKLQYADTRFTVNGANNNSEFRWLVKENTPEDCNDKSWGYTNCAAFTYEVYYQGLGYALPDDMFTTNRLVNYSQQNNMRVYYYSRTADSVQTDEEKQQVHDEFVAALQSGDILVVLRGGSGHAMLYVGDGKIIHSTGGVYQYTASVGTEVYEATIRCMNVEDYFFNEASAKGYVFGIVTDIAIVRPLNVFQGEIPQSTLTRMANMQGIVAQKISSHTEAQTVNPGDQMTFTYKLYNANKTDVTLDIAETLPQNTTYVSGAQTVNGNQLGWTVTVPAGQRVSVSYTLKVNEDTAWGTQIQSTDSTVGGITVKCDPVQVRRTLTSQEQAALVETVKQLRAEGNTLTNLALVNQIYEQALGVQNVFESTDIATVTRGTTGCFKNYKTYSGKQIYQCNPDSIYTDLIAPTLYGGYRLHTPNFTYDRIRLAKVHDLQVGDVLISKTLSSESAMMYLGEELGFVKMDAELTADTAAIEKRLERLLGYGYYFAIMRPSMGLEN